MPRTSAVRRLLIASGAGMALGIVEKLESSRFVATVSEHNNLQL